ncbi:2-dehydropantoate 2-reductase [Achromobacter arsenitoxydans SY8]|uniref:2-dehydropantoate 2-reductase n=1 Tax=Achromobacter arsenitoxydans SY8 TaxID=477184 RepID=H0F222_9BURK|nr:2-dehydropantoate 2-reductase [Achromobacter arsenitoxydans SY8]
MVWGGGAIGGVVAAKLADAGQDVLLVDVVPEHVEAVRAHGLEIVGPDGKSTFSRMQACLASEAQGTYSRIMLSVKGQHTRQAMQMIAPRLAAGGWVLALQNGLTEATIAGVVGQERTLGALVNFASDYVGPGRIQFGGQGSLRVGEIDGADTARSRQVEALLRQVDPQSGWTDRLMGYKWSKVAIGSLLFTTAMSNDTIVEQLGNRHYLPLWRALCREVVTVARASGVDPAPFDGFAPDAFTASASIDDAWAQMQQITDHCRRWVGKPRSGVWRDLAVRKRPTEVDPQITDIVAHGQAAGIETPTVSRLIAIIREMESGGRDFGNANLDALMETAA